MTRKEQFLTFGVAITVLVLLNVVLYPYLSNLSARSGDGTVISHCEKIPSVVSEKTVVLRIDDIQAFTWIETSKRMIEDALSRSIPLTLGVIPAGFLNDREMLDFLRERACSFDVGLHGWDHGAGEGGMYPEFGELSKDHAYSRIVPGIEVIKSITDEPVVTWIPPLNIHSEGTIEALHELGFKFLSTEGKGEYDYDAATFNYSTNTLIPPTQVVDDCEKAFKTDTKCIIMLHPQDFTNGPDHDEQKYTEYYLTLIDMLKEKGYTFARMRDLEAGEK